MNNIEFKYLNITEDDADFGLWVSTVGFQSIDPGMTYPIKRGQGENPVFRITKKYVPLNR